MDSSSSLKVPFMTKEHPIVHLPRIVHTGFVDQQTPDETANLKQCVPVAAVAREARCLDRQDGTGIPAADCKQQPFKSLTGNATAGSAEASSSTTTTFFHRGLRPLARARTVGGGSRDS